MAKEKSKQESKVTDEQVEAFKKELHGLQQKHGLRLQALLDYRAHGIVPTISLQEMKKEEK